MRFYTKVLYKLNFLKTCHKKKISQLLSCIPDMMPMSLVAADRLVQANSSKMIYILHFLYRFSQFSEIVLES